MTEASNTGASTSSKASSSPLSVLSLWKKAEPSHVFGGTVKDANKAFS